MKVVLDLHESIHDEKMKKGKVLDLHESIQLLINDREIKGS